MNFFVLASLLQVICIGAFPAEFEKVKALQTYRDVDSSPEGNSVFIGRYPRANHLIQNPATQTESRALDHESHLAPQEQSFQNEFIGFGEPVQKSVLESVPVLHKDESSDTFPAFVIRNTPPEPEDQLNRESSQRSFSEALVNSQLSFDGAPTVFNNNAPRVSPDNFQAQPVLDGNRFTSISQLPLESEPQGFLNPTRVTFPQNTEQKIPSTRQFTNEITHGFRSPSQGKSLDVFQDSQNEASNTFIVQQRSGFFAPGELQGGFSPCGAKCFMG